MNGIHEAKMCEDVPNVNHSIGIEKRRRYFNSVCECGKNKHIKALRCMKCSAQAKKDFNKNSSITEKKCTKCGIKKARKQFSRDKKLATGLKSQCKDCISKHQYEKRKNCPPDKEKERQVSIAWYANFKKNNPKECIRRRLFHSAKKRAKLGNLPFNITKEDIVFGDFCPVFGTKFVYDANAHCSISPSLDKIIPSKGYVKGNICVISFRANHIKSNVSLEDFQKLTRWYEGVLHSNGQSKAV